MKLQNQDILTDNETVLWEEKPQTFKILSKAMARELILKCVIIPLICIGVGCLHAANVDKINTGFIWFLVIVNAAVIFTALIKKPMVLRQRYLMTDKRVILVKTDEAYFINLNEMDAFRIVTGKSELPSVVFCSEIFPDIKSHLLWRACADVPVVKAGRESVQNARAFVFYNIKNATSLQALLEKR